MDTPTRGFPRGDLRVSDADRDRAVAELSDHYQAGRLTVEEFDDRSGRALQARTGTELGELFTDLPKPADPAASTPAPDGLFAAAARPRGRRPAIRIAIACVIAASILGTVLGNAGSHGHVGVSWLVPVVVLGAVFLRLCRGR
jgi:hypothetical protein